MPCTPAQRRYFTKIGGGGSLHLMLDKLEISVPLDKGHRMIMLMAQDKLPQIEQVDHPGATVWAQGLAG